MARVLWAKNRHAGIGYSPLTTASDAGGAKPPVFAYPAAFILDNITKTNHNHHDEFQSI
jgi:hypothetical protein